MAKTEEKEVNLTGYLNKKPTDLQERFADWLLEEDIVGYDPAKAKTKEEAFREGVRLATAMRMIFQASPENRAANAERKAALKSEVEEEAPAPKKAKKAAAATKAIKAKKAEPVEDDEAIAPPKKAKKAAKAKRRTMDDEDEAPF